MPRQLHQGEVRYLRVHIEQGNVHGFRNPVHAVPVRPVSASNCSARLRYSARCQPVWWPRYSFALRASRTHSMLSAQVRSGSRMVGLARVGPDADDSRTAVVDAGFRINVRCHPMPERDPTVRFRASRAFEPGACWWLDPKRHPATKAPVAFGLAHAPMTSILIPCIASQTSRRTLLSRESTAFTSS